MSRLYEVLENARREREGIKVSRGQGTPFRPIHTKSELEMLGLYQAINASLGKKSTRIVELMGTQEGEGCSTIALDLARIAATNPTESVLLLDLNPGSCNGVVASDAAFQHHFEKLSMQTTPLEGEFSRKEQDNLTVTSVTSGSGTSVAILNMSDNEDMWHRLGGKFSLVLIDVPPATVSPIGFSLLERVDGVVLVIREEKTRWPLAVDVKEKIVREGGKIIGVVYNDQHHYIPKWLNRCL
jgi:protein-tyrosine kinase